MTRLFSEREFGDPPRTLTEVSDTCWRALIVLIQGLIADGSLASLAPDHCEDQHRHAIVGCNPTRVLARLQGEVPSAFNTCEITKLFSIKRDIVTAVAFDLLEVVYRHVEEPIKDWHHDFFDHYHLRFDKDLGQSKYRTNVNRILASHRIGFELDENGLVRRLVPIEFEAMMTVAITSDDDLNHLLAQSIDHFLKAGELQHAVEKLWDGLERLKTVRDRDKKTGVKLLIDACTTSEFFREQLNSELRSLTDLGNTARIRHHENGKEDIPSDDMRIYLFYRAMSLIRHLIMAGGLEKPV
jgi:hypothetical protein